jgi:hypothetical protein
VIGDDFCRGEFALQELGDLPDCLNIQVRHVGYSAGEGWQVNAAGGKRAV